MESAKPKKGLVFFFILYVAYSTIYVARLNFSVASVLLQEGGTLSKAQVGIIGSIFSLAYAAMKLPGGYLGDRIAPKPLILIGLTVTGLSNLAIGFCPTFAALVPFWLLNSLGQSLLWGPVLRAVTEHYGIERSKLLNQYLVSSTAAGSVLGLLVSGFCSSAMGVESCFFIPGALALCMALLVLIFVPKADAGSGSQKAEMKKRGLRLPALLKDREFLWMALPALCHGLVKDNLNVWLASFFADRYGIDVKSIALYVFFIPVMALIGRFLYPAAAKGLKQNHVFVTLLGFMACMLFLIPLLFPGLPAVLAVLCLGILSALISLINTYILSLFPTKYADKQGVALVASLMDVLTYGGAGIGSLFFGFLIAGVGYNGMFLVWMAGCVVSALVLIKLQRTSSRRG